MVEFRVRPMDVEDLDIRIEYFQNATDEHLQLLGVDRAKLDPLEAWRESFETDLCDTTGGRPKRESRHPAVRRRHRA